MKCISDLIMSQATNGQHEEFVLNGPNSSFQASFQGHVTSDPELTQSTAPPIADFLTQLSDYNTTIPGIECYSFNLN